MDHNEIEILDAIKKCIQDKDKWLKNKNIYEPDKTPIFFNNEQLQFINSPLKDLKLIVSQKISYKEKKSSAFYQN